MSSPGAPDTSKSAGHETSLPPAGADQPTQAPAPKLSGGTMAAIGLGAAAVIGGIAMAAGGGGGGGDEAPPAKPEPQTPQITAADPPAGSTLSCSAGTVIFTFNTDMDISAGQVEASISEWSFTANFTDARTYIISWEGNCPESGDPADLPQNVTFFFANFQDASQNPLQGNVEFTFDLGM